MTHTNSRQFIGKWIAFGMKYKLLGVSRRLGPWDLDLIEVTSRWRLWIFQSRPPTELDWNLGECAWLGSTTLEPLLPLF